MKERRTREVLHVARGYRKCAVVDAREIARGGEKIDGSPASATGT